MSVSPVTARVDLRPAHGDGPGRRARIVFLVPTLDIGGAERQVLRTAIGLDRCRFDPLVLAFQRGGGRLARELEAAGIATVDLGLQSRRSPLAAFWRLARWLRAHPCDVLMAYMFHANLAARLVRPFAGVPRVVCSERVVGWESPLRVALNRATRWMADAITTNSAAGVRFWADRLGLPESRLHLIYNGVDVAAFSPRENRSDAPGPVVIGNLARLHRKNGQETLLEALDALASMPDLPPWRCVIAGEGPDAEALARTIARRSLEGRVELAGHVSDPVPFLRGVELYVQSSTAEGLPNAVLEAMATGIPVVATAVGGTPEVVEEGKTGWLVPAGDAIRLAERIAALLRAPAERAAMGREGRRRVEQRFSTTRMIAETERLLDELLATSAADRASSRPRD
jgi:glycosyltransferase involved in cell wall biosynthesis